MRWLKIRLTTSKDHVELIESLLLALDAASVILDDGADQPLLEPLPGETPIWDKVIVSGLFAEQVDPLPIIAFIGRQAVVSDHAIEYIENEAWERAWMDHYMPIQCGHRLWIVPEWLAPPDPHAINLKLDPGLAFGTGDHPTTYMCLQWLDSQPLAGKTVIDYGCGSGILGIAALLLGATQVWAVDIDPQAISAARQNAINNQVADTMWTGLPEEFSALGVKSADVVVANILAGPLAELSSTLAALCAPGGSIALAGLIESQRDELLQIYGKWFNINLVNRLQEDWCLLAGTKL